MLAVVLRLLVGIAPANIGCARGGMADTPDLGFGLWLFQQLSCSYIDSYITPVFIGLSSLFTLPSTIFNPNIKLAQKLAQYLQALDLVRPAPLEPLKTRCDADIDLQNHHAY